MNFKTDGKASRFSHGIMTTEKFLSTPWQNEDDGTAKTNQWINHNYEFLRGMYYHIPNESQKDQHRTNNKKGFIGRGAGLNSGDQHRLRNAAMGVLPGVMDFRFEQVYVTKHDQQYKTMPEKALVATIEVIAEYAYFVPGWYLELKMPGNKPSKPQLALMERWRCHGIVIEWADNAADVVKYVTAMYGKPLY